MRSIQRPWHKARSRGHSSRIVVPAVFPWEEDEEGVGRKGSGGIHFPSLPRACGGWKSLLAASPAPPGDKKEAGMVKNGVWDGGAGRIVVMVSWGGSSALEQEILGAHAARGVVFLLHQSCEFGVGSGD